MFKTKIQNGFFHRSFIIILIISFLGSLIVFAPVKVSASDEYDELREKWKNLQTGADLYLLPITDSDISAKVSAITDEAQGYWNSLDTSQNRTFLWSDVNSTTYPESKYIYENYCRILVMAKAYCTKGSNLENSSLLLSDITSALDWMYSNQYNQNLTWQTNYHYWEISVPYTLCNIVVLLYNELTSTQIDNYMDAVHAFANDPTDYAISSTVSYGANRLWESRVILLRGIIVKDSSRIILARDNLGDAEAMVYPFSESLNGWYRDGSFISHDRHPYNASYGAGHFSTLLDLVHLLDNSTWEFSDPRTANIFQWAYEGYIPLMHKGRIMDMVDGRVIAKEDSSPADHSQGANIISTFIKLIDIAAAEDTENFKKVVKEWIQKDTYYNFYEVTALYPMIKGKSIVSDANVTARQPDIFKMYAGMDRAAQQRPGYAFGVSMFSSRIYDFECIGFPWTNTAENKRGWYTSSGMTYIYDDDLAQYNENFWPTVDPYRLPGITVDSGKIRPDGIDSKLSSENRVGGTEINGLYGSVGMALDAYAVPLSALKSWFMFDDEIVALGAGITRADENVQVLNEDFESYLENDKPDGWSLDQSGGVVAVKSELSGNKYLKIYDNSTSGAVSAMSRFEPANGTVTVEYRVQAAQDNTLKGTPYVADSDGNVATEIIMNSNGRIAAYDGDVLIDLQDYDVDTWYAIKMIIDTDTDTYDVYIDDVKMADSFDLKNNVTHVGIVKYYYPEATTGWFYIDDISIYCYNPAPVETIIGNKRLDSSGDNAFVVDGTAKTTSNPWSETMNDVSWFNLEGNVSGSDTGYYFPNAVQLKALRETRSGSWNDISDFGSTTTRTNNFITSWIDHGTNPSGAVYAYAILPGKTSSETGSYASDPDFTVIANNEYVQAVKENTLNIVAANFWQDITKTADIITCDNRASVMTKETTNEIEVSIADLTQENEGIIEIDINKSAMGVISKDPEIIVSQLSPTIILTVQVNGSMGLTKKIKFSKTSTPSEPDEVLFIPEADSHIRGGSYADSNYGSDLTLSAQDSSSEVDVRKTYMRFDLSPVTSVTGARLRINACSSSGKSATLSVLGCASDSWTETGITWNNAPSYESGILKTIYINGMKQYYEFDITDFVDSQISGDKVVTLVLMANDLENEHIAIDSRESSYEPLLAIEGNFSGQTPPQPPESPEVPVTIVLDEDFDSYTVDTDPTGWTIIETGGAVDVKQFGGSSADKDLKIFDYSTTLSISAQKSFSAASGLVTVEYKVRAEQTDNSIGAAYTSDSSSLNAGVVLMRSTGYISAYDDETVVDLQPYSAQEWYRIKMVINTDADTYDVYIDDIKKGEGFNLRNSVSSITSIKFLFSTTPVGSLYVDDVRINYSSIPVIYAVNDDFNSQTTGGAPLEWTTDTSGGTVTVEELPSTEDKSVRIFDNSSLYTTAAEKSFFGQKGVVTVNYKIITNQTNVSCGAPYIYDSKVPILQVL